MVFPEIKVKLDSNLLIYQTTEDKRKNMWSVLYGKQLIEKMPREIVDKLYAEGILTHGKNGQIVWDSNTEEMFKKLKKMEIFNCEEN